MAQTSTEVLGMRTSFWVKGKTVSKLSQDEKLYGTYYMVHGIPSTTTEEVGEGATGLRQLDRHRRKKEHTRIPGMTGSDATGY